MCVCCKSAVSPSDVQKLDLFYHTPMVTVSQSNLLKYDGVRKQSMGET